VRGATDLKFEIIIERMIILKTKGRGEKQYNGRFKHSDAL
tara:strand:- start:196 stop:315 length:120 start_codon:yes stop_codon:yes gene_type:complete